MKWGFVVLVALLGVMVLASCGSASDVGLIENETWQQNLTAVYLSSIALGDLNNDSKPDLIVTGYNTSAVINVYINNGTVFVENETWQQNLSGAVRGSIAIGDIDNDGDLDLILTGCTTSATLCGTNTLAKVYINNDTSLVENETWQQNLTGVSRSSIALGDIDNDGNLDLVLTGNTDSGRISKIYINNNSAFLENSTWQQNLPGIKDGGLALGDVDDDGNLDLILGGLKAAPPYKFTEIYTNNGSTFVLQDNTWGREFTHISENSPIWGDYDNDGDLDLAHIGCCDRFFIYNNNGTVLKENQTDVVHGGDQLVGIFAGSIGFGDYDNDGDLDIAAMGRESGYDHIYNNNNNVFEKDTTADADMNSDNMQQGSLILGDIDSDNNLDLIIAGLQFVGANPSDPLAKVYINNITTNPNTAPNPPAGAENFSSSYSNSILTLTWNNGSDTETNTSGLYYNLRVGNSSGGHDIVSGVYGGSSNPTAGYFGNMMQRKSIALNINLESNQTIYWAVQTIDTSLAKSSWSVEQNYTVPMDSIMPTITLNAPANDYNTSNATLVFNATVFDNVNVTNASLWGNWGGWHLNETNSSGINNSDYIFTKNLSGFGDGSYSWHIQACDNTSNCINSSVRSFRIDTTYPLVTLISPDSGSAWSSNNSVTFTYNVTDAAVRNCSLIIDNETVSTNTSITVNTTQSFTRTLSNGNYDWYINCTDIVNHRNSSETRSLTVSYTAPTDGGNGGGNGGGGGITTPTTQVTYTWDKIEAGGTGTVAISREGLDVTEISVQVKEKITAPQITVQKLDARPSGLPAPSGSSYQYIQITPTKLEESNIKNAAIRFRVGRSWITANNIDEDTIILNRYASGTWVRLPTRKVESGSAGVTGAVIAGEEGCGLLCILGNWLGSITGFLVSGDYIYYEANTTGFSYFVITGDAKEVAPTPPSPKCNNNGVCEPGEMGCPDCMAYELNCTPGYRQCSGNLLFECDVDGSEWFIVENCSYVCANGGCWPPVGISELEQMYYMIWIISIVVVCLVGYILLNKFYKRY